ncbi:hypothetical protein LTR66_008090 [Elasticomyces elasticus]|nr:hypothetical protein LTR66_008090 [Elasticomyces elasticus]
MNSAKKDKSVSGTVDNQQNTESVIPGQGPAVVVQSELSNQRNRKAMKNENRQEEDGTKEREPAGEFGADSSRDPYSDDPPIPHRQSEDNRIEVTDDPEDLYGLESDFVGRHKLPVSPDGKYLLPGWDTVLHQALQSARTPELAVAASGEGMGPNKTIAREDIDSESDSSDDTEVDDARSHTSHWSDDSGDEDGTAIARAHRREAYDGQLVLTGRAREDSNNFPMAKPLVVLDEDEVRTFDKRKLSYSPGSSVERVRKFREEKNKPAKSAFSKGKPEGCKPGEESPSPSPPGSPSSDYDSDDSASSGQSEESEDGIDAATNSQSVTKDTRRSSDASNAELVSPVQAEFRKVVPDMRDFDWDAEVEEVIAEENAKAAAAAAREANVLDAAGALRAQHDHMTSSERPGTPVFGEPQRTADYFSGETRSLTQDTQDAQNTQDTQGAQDTQESFDAFVPHRSVSDKRSLDVAGYLAKYVVLDPHKPFEPRGHRHVPANSSPIPAEDLLAEARQSILREVEERDLSERTGSLLHAIKSERADGRIRRLQERLTQEETEVLKWKTYYCNLQDELDNAQSDLAEVQHQVKERKRKIDDYKSLQTAAHAKINELKDDLQKERSGRNMEIESLKIGSDEREERIRSLEQRIQQCEKRGVELSAALAKAEHEKKLHEAKLGEAEAKCASLEQNREQLEAKVNKAEADLAAELNREPLRPLSEVDREHDLLMKSKRSLEEERDTLHSALAAAGQQVEKIKTDLESQLVAVTVQARNEKADLGSALAVLRSQFETSKTALEEELAESKKDVRQSAWHGQILVEENAALKGEIATLKEGNATLKAQLETAQRTAGAATQEKTPQSTYYFQQDPTHLAQLEARKQEIWRKYYENMARVAKESEEREAQWEAFFEQADIVSRLPEASQRYLALVKKRHALANAAV